MRLCSRSLPDKHAIANFFNSFHRSDRFFSVEVGHRARTSRLAELVASITSRMQPLE